MLVIVIGLLIPSHSNQHILLFTTHVTLETRYQDVGFLVVTLRLKGRKYSTLLLSWQEIQN